MSRPWWYRAVLIVGSGTSVLFFVCGWIIYYVTAATWSEEAFSRFVTALNNNLAVQIVTLLFVLSLLLFIIRSSVNIVRDRAWLLPFWVLLPAGVFIYLVGFFLNAAISIDGKIIVGLGDEIKPPWEKKALFLKEIDSGLQKEFLGSGSTESVLFQYEPSIVLSGPSKEYLVRGFPPTKIGSTYYHILDFGFAPGFKLWRDGQVILESYVIQSILPPGSVDSFFLGDLPYRVELRIAPSRVIQKEGTEVPVYSLTDIRYNVLIYMGDDVIFEGPSAAEISFNNLKLEFVSHTYWVRVEAARRPGMVPLVTGLAFIVIGFPIWLGLKIVHLIQGRRLNSG